MNKQIFKLLTILVLLISLNISFAATEIEQLPVGTRIVCAADSPKGLHLQGITSCGKYIYWVFSKKIIKTDPAGRIIKNVPLHKEAGKRVHGGSPAWLDKLYVPYCASGFNKKLNGQPSLNFVQVYDADLNYVKSIPIPELEYGAGAMTTDGTNFFVTGGRPADLPGNTIYEYSRDFKLLKKHKLSFNTFKGIQTFACNGKYFYAGCYGSENFTYRISRDFKTVDYLNFNTSVGLYPMENNRMLAARIGLDAKGKEETFAEVIKLENYLLNVAAVELKANGEVFLNGKKIPASGLINIFRQRKYALTVLRCPENTPLKKIVELQVFISGRFVIEFTK